MQTITRLFGKSPFIPLQAHMEKVASCVRQVPFLFDAWEKKNYEEMTHVADKIYLLEHEADTVKNSIRDHLPSGLFLPIAKTSLLEILSHQDNLADRAEDFAVLATLQKLEIPPLIEKELGDFLQKNLEAFEEVFLINQEMGFLLESSFGGSEAEKVHAIVERVGVLEHDADLLQRALLKHLFSDAFETDHKSFYLWVKMIGQLAALSDGAETLANRIRMILEVK